MKLFFTILLFYFSACLPSHAQMEDALKLWVGDELMPAGGKVSCTQIKPDEFGMKMLYPNIALENTSDETVTAVVAFYVKKLENGTILVCGDSEAGCVAISKVGNYQSYILNIKPGKKELLDFKMSILSDAQPHALEVELQIERLRSGSTAYAESEVLSREVKGTILGGTSISTDIVDIKKEVESSFVDVYDIQGHLIASRMGMNVLGSLRKGLYICKEYLPSGELLAVIKYVKK